MSPKQSEQERLTKGIIRGKQGRKDYARPYRALWGHWPFFFSTVRSYMGFKQNIPNITCFLKYHSRFCVEKRL